MTPSRAILLLAMWCSGTVAAQPNGTVSGTVIDGTTGRPIPRAVIQVREQAHRPYPGMINLSTLADAAGKFVVRELHAGSYSISASKPGFVFEASSIPEDQFSSGGDDDTSNVVIRMMRQSFIRGHVVDSDGEPREGYLVRVFRTAFDGGTRDLEQAHAAKVNPDGDFLLGPILPGRYYLCADGDVRSQVPNSIAMSVQTCYSDTTQLSQARPLDVGPGGELNGISIRVHSTRGFHVGGRIADGSWTVQTLSLRSLTEPASVLLQGFTDAKGNFEFGHLPRGSYALSVFAMKAAAPQGFPAEIRMAYLPLIVDRDIDRLNVPLVAVPDFTMAVHTVNPADQPAFLKSIPQNLRVFFHASYGEHREEQSYIDRSGTSRIRLLISGPAEIGLLGLPGEYFVASVRYNGSDVTRSTALLEGTVGNVEVLVAPGAAAVAGSVAGTAGESLENIPVTLWEAAAPPPGTREFFQTVLTNSAGEFVFQNLPPGEYRIVAWRDREQELAEYPDFHRRFEAEAVNVRVGSAARETVELTAIPRKASEARARAVQ